MPPKKRTASSSSKKQPATPSNQKAGNIEASSAISTFERLSPFNASSSPSGKAKGKRGGGVKKLERQPNFATPTTPSPSPSIPFDYRSPSSDQKNLMTTNSLTIEINPFLLYAALAGTCGSLSSICSKVGVSTFATTITTFLMQNFLALLVSTSLSSSFFSADVKSSSSATREWLETSVESVIRISMLLLNGFFTAQMWRFYLKALSLGSTPVAQAVNTAANFAVSALVGAVLFGETVGHLWIIGATCTAIGLALLTF